MRSSEMSISRVKVEPDSADPDHRHPPAHRAQPAGRLVVVIEVVCSDHQWVSLARVEPRVGDDGAGVNGEAVVVDTLRREHLRDASRMPPTRLPAMDPSPPMMTVPKAMSRNCGPSNGWKVRIIRS